MVFVKKPAVTALFSDEMKTLDFFIANTPGSQV